MNFLTNKIEFIKCFQFCCYVKVAFIHKQDRKVATTSNNGKYAWVSIAVPICAERKSMGYIQRATPSQSVLKLLP